MKAAILFVGVWLLCGALSAQAQETQSGGGADVRPVPLTEQAVALDTSGQTVLAASLRSAAIEGPPEALTKNARLILENRSQVFYTYASGYATFYDAGGVRCGEGLWTLSAFAPGERAEVDTPGLRLTAKPAAWRITAINLLMRAGDAPRPSTTVQTINASARGTNKDRTATLPPLQIEINGATLPVQLGNPLEIEVGKERVRIVLRVAP
ncbi:MAG: hypothetical protein H0V88_04755 [Pyrinomonadaceae bacterium]|nr:hypothetical protein [Pyrinomonadaceae bacterium]